MSLLRGFRRLFSRRSGSAEPAFAGAGGGTGPGPAPQREPRNRTVSAFTAPPQAVAPQPDAHGVSAPAGATPPITAPPPASSGDATTLPETEFPLDSDQRADITRGQAGLLARQVLAPHIRRAAQGCKVWPYDSRVGQLYSQLGGQPRLPGADAWPTGLHFLAQIYLPELPQTAETSLLPATGMLSFFIDANAGFPQAAPHLRILHLPEHASALHQVPPPDHVPALAAPLHDLPCRDPFGPMPRGFTPVTLAFEPLDTVPILAREGLEDPRIMALDRWMMRDSAAFAFQVELLQGRFGPEPVRPAVGSVLDDPAFPYSRTHALKLLAYHIDRIAERRAMIRGSDPGDGLREADIKEVTSLERLLDGLTERYRRLRDRGLGPEMDAVDRALFADQIAELSQTAYLAADIDLNQAAMFATVEILSDPSGRHDLVPPQEVARLRQRFAPCRSAERLFHYHHQVLGYAHEEVKELGAASAAVAVDWGWADGPDGDVALARASRWRLLLQLGADADQETLWSESGTLYLAIPDMDLRQGRFDRVIAHWQGV